MAAQDAPAGVGQRELWVGADAGAQNWLVYTGGTYAPWSDIHQDGFRLRSTAGYGAYAFNVTRGTLTTTKFSAAKSYADAMLGYQARFGHLTAKALIGFAALQTELTGGARHLRDIETGAKGVLELWLNLGNDAWASADFSYADTHQTASMRLRSGYRILPTVSVGAEAVLNHAQMDDTVAIKTINDGRIGLFARYEWFGGEISASAGVAGNIGSSLDGSNLLHEHAAYGTMNWIVQF